MLLENKPQQSPSWLPKSYSGAFVVCLGAGPWRFGRRRHIQSLALSKIQKRDLRYLKIEECDFYPLKWQNDILKNIVSFLRKRDITFFNFCQKIIKNNDIKILYSACGKNNHIKTLSLFCRDKLKIDSFPIDRHVMKILRKFNMPINEFEMIKICQKYNMDSSKVAYGLVSKNLDKGNPDWSNYEYSKRK